MTGLLSPEVMRVDDARVLVAEFRDGPPRIKETIWTRHTDKGRELGLVVVRLSDGQLRILDVDASDRRVRWWKVEAMAQAEQMQTLPVSWDGPAHSLPKQYTQVDPAFPNRVVMVRLADQGPWAIMNLQDTQPEARSE